MNYSKWKGTARDYQRERYIFNDLERELEATSIRAFLSVGERERLPLAETARDLEMPWLQEKGDDKTILQDLDEFLENAEK